MILYWFRWTGSCPGADGTAPCTTAAAAATATTAAVGHAGRHGPTVRLPHAALPDCVAAQLVAAGAAFARWTSVQLSATAEFGPRGAADSVEGQPLPDQHAKESQSFQTDFLMNIY